MVNYWLKLGLGLSELLLSTYSLSSTTKNKGDLAVGSGEGDATIPGVICFLVYRLGP